MIKKILGLFSILIFSLFLTHSAQASCSASAEITMTIRDSEGKFIPNANFQIFEQVTDIDGVKKAGSSVASGRIDEVMGSDDVNIRSDNGIFVIKAWDPNIRDKDEGGFWFWDQEISCGEKRTISLILSSFRFILRDTDNNLKIDQDFELYLQETDADGDPVRGDLMGDLKIPEKGYEVLYVPSQSKTVDGEDRHYLFQTKNENNGLFELKNIRMSDQKTFKIEYIFSSITIKLKDQNGISLLQNTSLDLYKQEKDNNDEKMLGEEIKTLKTDNNGIINFEYPAGTYAARVTYSNKQTETFWNLKIADGANREYELVAHSTESVGKGTCSTPSELSIVTKDMQGNFIKNLNFEIFEQVKDTNNKDAKGDSIKKGKINENGYSKIIFNPDPRKKYALKLYDKNDDAGDYWFFNAAQFECSQNKSITKYLPKIKVILRDGEGELKKQQKFSLYTQKFDADGEPIKEKKDLISSNFTTNESGTTNVYIAPSHPYILDKRGTFVFVSKGESKIDFEKYNIYVQANKDTLFEYTFSDILITLKNAYGEPIVDTDLNLYEKSQNVQGEYLLGRSLGKFTTDTKGQVSIEYSPNKYILSVKDDVRQDIIFEDIKIIENKRTTKTLQTNLVKVGLREKNSKILKAGESLKVHQMIESDDGIFYEDKSIKTLKTEADGYAKVTLAPGPYLFKYKLDRQNEYGIAKYLENEKIYNITIDVSNDNLILEGKKFFLEKPQKQTKNIKLRGYILLQVEQNGEAWYVNPGDSQRYYMKDGVVAYEMMRKFGLGITNADLEKIPIGLDDRFNEQDSDRDGLHNKMEEALGTDPNDPDSDDDGYLDGEEVRNGYTPLGPGKLINDYNFSEGLKGKILLQIESRGEAWYINPKDGRRYYMKNGDSAYEIMRFLSLGITDSDLDEIEEGDIE